MKPWPLEKIVSGGQTGVDRAALDVAMYLAIPCGGWCPFGRRSEDGTIPPVYELKETDSRNYAVRTEQNVVDSDATLILFANVVSGGTALTCQFAKRYDRSLLTVDLVAKDHLYDPHTTVRDWIQSNRVGVLNVAGPRESSHPGIGHLATEFLLAVLKRH